MYVCMYYVNIYRRLEQYGTLCMYVCINVSMYSIHQKKAKCEFQLLIFRSVELEGLIYVCGIDTMYVRSRVEYKYRRQGSESVPFLRAGRATFADRLGHFGGIPGLLRGPQVDHSHRVQKHAGSKQK